MSLNGQQLLQGLSRVRGVYTHGSSGYRYGCRCGVCRAGMAVKRASAQRQSRAAVHAVKAVPCADCGASYPYYVMDFDHRPGTEKTFNVGAMGGRGRSVVQAEIDKCDVVCANCHRERTHARREAELCR